jgi:hypothetical protein
MPLLGFFAFAITVTTTSRSGPRRTRSDQQTFLGDYRVRRAGGVAAFRKLRRRWIARQVSVR